MPVAIVGLTAFFLVLLACKPPDSAPRAAIAPDDALALESEDEKILYALGRTLSRNVDPLDLSPAELGVVTSGLRDAVEGRDSRVPMEEYGPKIQAFAHQRLDRTLLAEKEASGAFLEAERTVEGIETLASGVLVRVIARGTGPSPAETDTVRVHYRGTLRDGTVFDSSVEREEPATFPMNRVVSCWRDVLPRMSVGEKVRLVCPAETAFGDRGWAPKVPPGAALAFDLELLGIAEPAPPETTRTR